MKDTEKGSTYLPWELAQLLLDTYLMGDQHKFPNFNQYAALKNVIFMCEKLASR